MDAKRPESRVAGVEDAVAPSDATFDATVDESRVAAVAQSKLTLRFEDVGLEQAYLESEFKRSATWVPKTLLFSGLLALSFLPVDGILVPESAVTMTRFIRAFLIVPIPLFGVVGYLVIRRPSARARLIEFGATSLGLLWTAMILVGGPDSVPYHTFALIQTQLGAFILLALPYRRALRTATFFSAVFLAGVAYLDTPIRMSLLAYAGVPAFLLIAAIGQYRYESASRRRFLAERQLVAEFELRSRAERERRQWLETIAGFLRHEMRNSLAGVGSSLELTRRVMQDVRGHEYIERALRSLQFMRQMLRQVAEATTIEAALRTQRQERVDLAALISERVADLQADEWQRVELVEAEASLDVLCDPDSIVQLLDKLVNNAIEHAAAESRVTVNVRRDGLFAQIEVVDIGDPLPDSTERLFQPFISSKSGSGEGNLGLGLYVAKVIATHHDGDIRAERLADPTGARFVVRLPLASYGAGP